MLRLETRRATIAGVEHTFQVLPHPEAVGIIAWQNSQMALVRQLRPAINRVILEIPAGVLEPNEPPAMGAARELAEETGLRAKHLNRLGGLYAAPGYSSEYIHVFLATGLVAGKPDFDAGEEILELQWVTPEELTERIRQGEVEDAMTIAALHMLQCYLSAIDNEVTGK